MKKGEAWVDLVSQGRTIHLVGIGGAGMAGLALLLEARGATVTGCDRESGPVTSDLEARGMIVHQGHSPGHVNGAAAVVHTAAVPADHPELESARARGLPVLKRSQALADLVNGECLVAIAGTHGKTTTTALAAEAVEALGLRPTSLVGGRVVGWGGNALIGGAGVHVVEADEYDRSFLLLDPKIAVVTSVESDHLDTYATAERLEAAFDEFIDRVPEDGRVLACVDDPGARRRLERVGDRGLGYGIHGDAPLKAASITYEPSGTRFAVTYEDQPVGEFRVRLSGRHNVLNTLAALGVVHALGREPREVGAALEMFQGVERRFQKLGDAAGVTVVDDYAHHPTEVRETLQAARQVFGDRRLVAAFQPHLYSRTRAFAVEFGRALAGADVVFVTGVYAAREKPIAGISGRLVAEAAADELGTESVHYVPELGDLTLALESGLVPGDVLLTLGAGDIGEAARAVFAELGGSHVDE